MEPQASLSDWRILIASRACLDDQRSTHAFDARDASRPKRRSRYFNQPWPEAPSATDVPLERAINPDVAVGIGVELQVLDDLNSSLTGVEDLVKDLAARGGHV